MNMVSILVIDDETDVRASVSKILGRAGYDVTATESAESGLQMLVGQSFDVLITDIIMPGMDGVQAIRRVREEMPSIKIIAISGGGNFGMKNYEPTAITTSAYLQAARAAGADWIMTKPFARADLVEAVEQLTKAA
jgi:CheY-like chemotaxis protein